ncbi:MAG: AMP-binding protein [Gemmatimonadetes bacterium]|nr:AMP-binding protein [Gemmatimonadota bacterium]
MVRSAGLTVGDLIVEALGRFSDREAFVLGAQRVTYAQTADTISRFVRVLAERGIGPGSAVAALSPNMPEVWLLQAAAYLVGATYTGLHPLGSVSDHAYVCEDAGIGLLVVHPRFAETGVALVERCPGIGSLLSLGPSSVGEDLLTLAASSPGIRLSRGPAGEDETAWLQYTGGTTGKPKGVMVPSRALVAETYTLTCSWGLPERPRFLLTSPITHAGSLPILPTLCRGGTVVLQQSFDPAAWLDAVTRERINYAFVVPTMLYAMLDHASPGRCDLSSLETVLYGAAPMAPARIAEALEEFGPVLMQGYGQTECLGMCTSLRKDEHDPVGRSGLLASCGRAVAGARVEVLGEDGSVLPAGEVGEVCLRSPVVMAGYHGRSSETAAALAGGWLHTGDLGVRDSEGFLYLVDRKKDVIVSGAFNVYPREIEDVISGCRGVSAVAVIGVPDERWGEAVTAFVAARPGEVVDVEEVRKTVREVKGAHQVPKAVHVVTELPKTAAGKIDKKALRKPFWGEGGRQIH